MRKRNNIVLTVFFMFLCVLASCNFGADNRAKQWLQDSIAKQRIRDSVDSVTRVRLAEYRDDDGSRKSKEGQKWQYTSNYDEMAESYNVFASIMNERVYDYAEYAFKHPCRISIRYRKKDGVCVIIRIGDGIIYGSEYNNENYVLVKFDSEKAIKYFYDETASGSSDVIFIRKTKDFIAHCEKASSIKIEIPIYRQGRYLYKFKISDPLVWEYNDKGKITKKTK